MLDKSPFSAYHVTGSIQFPVLFRKKMDEYTIREYTFFGYAKESVDFGNPVCACHPG